MDWLITYEEVSPGEVRVRYSSDTGRRLEGLAIMGTYTLEVWLRKFLEEENVPGPECDAHLGAMRTFLAGEGC